MSLCRLCSSACDKETTFVMWSVICLSSKSLAALSDMLHLIFGTSFLYHSSKLFTPLSATFIWTCRFNLLHTAITFHHFLTLLLWAQNLPFLKILSSTLDCFVCRTYLMVLGRLLDLLAHRFLCFSCIFLCFSYSYVWQTKLGSSLVNFWAHNIIVFDLIWFRSLISQNQGWYFCIHKHRAKWDAAGITWA